MVVCGRLSPPLVTPVGGGGVGGGKHAGEVAGGGYARSGESGTRVGVSPRVATVRGPVNFVDVVMREAASSFVHASDVDIARGKIARDLDVADEWGASRDLSLGPVDTVIRVADEDALASRKIVP